jgi:ABC-type antimicrobial peptide transport system permease subunit
MVYRNVFQETRVFSHQFALRTAVAPTAVAGEARRAVRETLRTVSIGSVRTLTEQVDASIIPERLIATLAGFFGALGALLAAIGVYGLLAYTVARRTNEIGVRMALGATSGDVTRMVLLSALGLAAAGLALGAPLALWARRIAVAFVSDLPAGAALPIGSAVIAMTLVALVAAVIPARRASRVNPVEALRQE